MAQWLGHGLLFQEISFQHPHGRSWLSICNLSHGCEHACAAQDCAWTEDSHTENQANKYYLKGRNQVLRPETMATVACHIYIP